MKKIEPEKLTIKEFREFWLQPILPIREINDLEDKPLYKSLPFWRRKGLLPFVQDGDWNVEVSFSQLIWMRIIDHLRQLGYSIADLAKLTDRLFKDAYYANLHTQLLLERKIELQGKVNRGKHSEDDLLLLQHIERVMSDPFLNYSLKIEVNYLTELIRWALNYPDQEAALLIFPAGKVLVKKGDDAPCSLSNDKRQENKLEESAPLAEIQDNPSPRSPHIYLSLRELLSEFIEKSEWEEKLLPYFMNEEEKQVIRELRNSNVLELNIRMKGGNIQRMSVTQDEVLSNEKARAIRRILGLHNYEEVNVRTLNSKDIRISRTHKTIKSG